MKGKCSHAWLLQLLLALLALSRPDCSLAAALTSETRQPTVTIGSSIGITTCPFRTANYITHGLPQQCLRTSRVVPTRADSTNDTGRLPVSDNDLIQEPSLKIEVGLATTTSIDFGSKFERDKSSSFSPSAEEQPPSTEDAETPIDTANFLSFEEWKVQNLAKAGQSAENFGERPPKEVRRRPGSISSALDALGEDAEIDLEFGAEGDEKDVGVDVKSEAKPSETVEPTKHVRSKDAGKTCKERFNYASFDCAATVHKTNPESKGSSAILVENKDSYMLNKCGAKNKFVIVELCDDILVDTVVIANYEFFSSMLRAFRVSVSDRYPVKSSGWKDLGVFEAKNSREVQAFLVENPLIWARYIRIEFLTHYGKEFYCPISLLRVHGTTMMEEFRHQEEQARGYNEDETEEIDPEAVAEPIEEAEKEEHASREAASKPQSNAEDGSVPTREIAPSAKSTLSLPPDSVGPALAHPTKVNQHGSTSSAKASAIGSEHQDGESKPSSATSQSPSSTSVSSNPKDSVSSEENRGITITPSSERISSKPGSKSPKTTPSDNTHSSHTGDATTPRNSNSASSEPRHPSVVAPSVPSPTTQESFFKTIHKRLQLLEANATLSLQYIEEQSRLMRDTFSKMEKRQFNKSASYLGQLNGTVFRELREFRLQYDQLWQSTVIALDTQRELSEREILAISSRLTMLADEIVFQKRMTIAQSFLMILVVCLVVFSKTQNLEAGFVRTVFPGRSQDHLGLESPPTSPSPPRVRPKSVRGANNKKRLREFAHHHQRRDSSDLDIPTMNALKRTPIPAEFYDERGNVSTENISEGLLDNAHLQPVSPPMMPQLTQSSPATPSGLNSLKEKTWASSASDGEYMTPDTAAAMGRQWRTTSPLSRQVIGREDLEEEDDDDEEGEVDDEEAIPDAPGSPVSPESRAGGRAGIYLESQYNDSDGAIDSYFL
ncbi:hypothetical protein H072_9179 [Dactylellina haptotyla CBS 200.50]|uniref:SUN domain-containing protein n=1 Tax=Dactylellina haptotyla (strain CBS 200.50) TaxID=1284197 RepID=S8A7R9_DACHA|nr:hypothetical protein H072_9179 [Dactylellina haptotyla CBS 200.50]